MPFRSFAADDIFISYTRLDASTYAAGLADELTRRGFSCFIDKLGTVPDKDLPDMLRRKIRSCAMLVVVGTERAAARETIEEEVREFLRAGRGSSVVPVDFGGAVYRARWYPLVEGVAPEPEKNPDALDDGEPSPAVLSRIEKQFTYRRREERLRRVTRRAILVLVGLLVAIAGAAGVAYNQLRRAAAATEQAAAATAKADEEAGRAERAARDARQAEERARVAQDEAEAAQTEAEAAQADAREQKAIAGRATKDAEAKTKLAEDAARRARAADEAARSAQAEADRQLTIAASRRLANQAQTFLRQRPREVARSVTRAVEALTRHPTVEADSALRQGLSLLPRLHVRETYEGEVAAAALSPDGRYFATLAADGDELRVYEVGSRAPLKKLDCRGRMIALSSGATYAAVADGREVTVFDLGGGPPRLLRLPEEVELDKIALSPGGQYLAVVHLVPEMEGQPVSYVRVYDAAGKVVGDNLLGHGASQIAGIAFGPRGDLAVAYGFYAITWPLAARFVVGEAGAGLTADDFPAPIRTNIAESVSAVTPGTEPTVLATDSAVWEEGPGGALLPRARLPLSPGVGRRLIAFSPDGTRLTVADGTPPPPDQYPREVSPRISLEVWDAAGHRELARAATSRFKALGFDPDGRVVASVRSAGHGGVVSLLGVRGEAVTAPRAGQSSAPETTLYVSPDAGYVVTSDMAVVSAPTATVTDVYGGRSFTVPGGHGIVDLKVGALSRGGEVLALAGNARAGELSRDGGVAVYARRGEAYAELTRLPFEFVPVDLALSPDGRLLAVVSGSRVELVELPVGRPLPTVGLGALDNVVAVKFSPGGRFLAVTTRGYGDAGNVETVHVWRVGAGAGATQRLEHGSAIKVWTFSPDDRYLLTAGTDGSARLLDLLTGRPAPISEQTTISAGGFSPDGRHLAVGTTDGDLVIYQTGEFEEEVARLTHDGSVEGVAFSRDDRYVATVSRPDTGRLAPGGNDQSVRVWSLRPGDLMAEATSRLCMQPGEERPKLCGR